MADLTPAIAAFNCDLDRVAIRTRQLTRPTQIIRQHTAAMMALLSPHNFITMATIIVIDLSYKNEMTKSDPTDVRVSAELSRASN